MGLFDSLGGAGNMLDSFLHPERGFEAGEGALRKQYGETQRYEKPYWQRGMGEYERLNRAIKSLMDPEGLTSKWAAGYETSPYAQRMLEMSKGQGLDAASSMGLMGSSGALGNIQQGASDIVSRDRREYLNDLMEKYMKGIGLSSGMYGMGEKAAGNLAQYSNDFGTSMANMEYGREAAPGKLLENLLRTAAGTYANMQNPGAGAAAGGGGNSFNPAIGG